MKRVLFAIIIVLSACTIANAQVKRGYRGFVGLDGGSGHAKLNFAGYDFTASNIRYTEIYTIHGHQFNPYFYLGGGYGFVVYHSNDFLNNTEFVTLNLLIATRVNLLNQKNTPYIDIMAGYSAPLIGDMADITDNGRYFTPSVGYHITVGKRFGINLGIGYSYHKFDVWEKKSGKLKINSWNLRFGIDF